MLRSLTDIDRRLLQKQESTRNPKPVQELADNGGARGEGLHQARQRVRELTYRSQGLGFTVTWAKTSAALICATGLLLKNLK